MLLPVFYQSCANINRSVLSIIHCRWYYQRSSYTSVISGHSFPQISDMVNLTNPTLFYKGQAWYSLTVLSHPSAYFQDSPPLAYITITLQGDTKSITSAPRITRLGHMTISR